ncbi:hypothetical protein ZWY2020_011209 [Hordeum vulgare]|nr:hypothetical protein ZWY2020_011209 [Hordeum vulgare]
MDQLSELNIQLETEVPVLRDGLKKLDEVLETSRAELQERQSLDSATCDLKQSLAEKSGELEKRSQELESKDALVKELEAKLKSYTEADRIEALESELSYIRNSATALKRFIYSERLCSSEN